MNVTIWRKFIFVKISIIWSCRAKKTHVQDFQDWEKVGEIEDVEVEENDMYDVIKPFRMEDWNYKLIRMYSSIHEVAIKLDMEM
jgi:hypothetical protein